MTRRTILWTVFVGGVCGIVSLKRAVIGENIVLLAVLGGASLGCLIAMLTSEIERKAMTTFQIWGWSAVFALSALMLTSGGPLSMDRVFLALFGIALGGGLGGLILLVGRLSRYRSSQRL